MRLRKILLCLAGGFALVTATQSLIYQHRHIISALMDIITTQTTDVCPCRIFMVRLPIYFRSPASVSSVAAIGATAAGMHVAGAIPAGAAMAVKYGIVAISGGTGGRRFGWGK